MRLKEFFDLDDETLDQMLEIMDTPEFQRWFQARMNDQDERRDPCEPYPE